MTLQMRARRVGVPNRASLDLSGVSEFRPRLTSKGEPEFDLVIAGGGICGAVAATLASSAGLRVAILEAADELGGNARAGRSPAGIEYPRGSSVLCTISEQQRTLLRELGVELLPKYRVKHDRVLSGGSWRRLRGDAQSPASELERQLEDFALHCEEVLTNQHGRVGLTVHDLPDAAFVWDRRSFHEAYAELPPELYAALAVMLRSNAASSPRQVSALAAMVDLVVCLKSQAYVLPGGNHAIVSALKRRWSEQPASCPRPRVRCASQVIAVTETDHGAVVRVREPNSGLEYNLAGRHALLALPSHVVAGLPGVPLAAAARHTFSELPRGTYTLVHFHLPISPLEACAFYMSPEAEWLTDVLQVSAEQDEEGRPRPEACSVLTAYVPGVTLGADDVAHRSSLVQNVKREILEMFPDNRHLRETLETAAVEVTSFSEAMSAPAPGQLESLRALEPRLSPRIHYGHSDLGFFSALGAIEVARAAVADILSSFAQLNYAPSSWAKDVEAAG